MNQHNFHLLDLPNEILFLILRKLDNIDVLYSLLGINNQRVEIIVQRQIFTSTLNFASISQSTDEISSISGSILDRFCIDILPKIHKNVKSLILEPVSMDRILRAGNYPNLSELKLFNFNKAIFSRYFMDDTLFGNISKEQITDLILIIKDNKSGIAIEEYTKNVYAVILAFFKNLQHLTIVVSSSIDNYPRLSLRNLPPMTFSSSTLTKLHINVNDFNDVRALLDGRLKQLTTFIVQVEYISDWISTSHNRNDLPYLKCFSLTCYHGTREYDNLIVRLLRRMTNLEELTLYLHIFGGSTFIAGTDLENEILTYMPRLHTFTFYITSENVIADPTVHISDDDIKRTFTNIKHGQMACMVDYFIPMKIICRVFSLPFKFHVLERITNNIPNIVFNSVTDLKLNILPPFWRFHEFHLLDKDWCSLVEYPHLISLDMKEADIYYVEHFLNETKTYLPRLTKLKIDYQELKMVTKNFTRDETRSNCARVKQLNGQGLIVYPKKVYCYFSLLSV
ncbi:unnamed protein product [Rotaria sordida]|uniref:F-box domain-containing protein n=1 Tax=Rotaria sordida TaxID=392033 RepID=A0A814DHN7_9BILA|nr:unnamed protein product [Rotaria sordida]CAF1617831.1 unnamed protein product [Rotaria sordida]